MTPQKIFDKVVTHLAKQKRAARKDHGCLYKTEDGRMCAVGCLMNDGEIKLALRNAGGIDSLLEDDSVKLRPFFEKKLFIIRGLQIAHDTARDVDDLKNRLKLTGGLYELDTEIVDTVTEWTR